MCFYVFEHDYMIGLISEESLTFGLLTIFRLLYRMGTFKVLIHVFYVLKYDPHTLMYLSNHMVTRQQNVVI